MASRKRASKKISPTARFEVALAGSTFTALKSAGWKKKPIRERKRGFGVTHYFDLSGTEAKHLVERMTELEADYADFAAEAKNAKDRGEFERIAEKFYDDLTRFPQELQPR